MQIKYKKKHPDAIPFQYTREKDACMDMFSLIDKTLYAGETAIIPTGIILEIPTGIEIPEGYEGIVRGRSGLASNGIHVHLGTIDENYVGDIGIIITNNSNKLFHVAKGSRLAQFTIKPVYRIDLIEVQEIKDTERGENGYGSSGY